MERYVIIKDMAEDKDIDSPQVPNKKDLLERIKSGEAKFEDLDTDTQVSVYNRLMQGSDIPPEIQLLRASQSRNHEFTNIRGDENCKMDRNVYKVRQGNYVMATYERSSAEYSRAQAGFLTEVVEDSLMDPTITIANLPDVLKEEDVKGKSREEIREMLLEHILSGGKIEDIGIDRKYRLIEQMQGQNYHLITVIGEVKEPPSHFNDGGLIIRGKEGERNLDIEMSNVRMLHIVGVNVPRIKGIEPRNN